MRRCVFCKVQSRTKEPGTSFLRFPADENVLQFWIQNMGYDPNWRPTRYQYLCSKHFSRKCYDLVDGRIFLRKGSIPTIFDGRTDDNADLFTNYRQILMNQQVKNDTTLTTSESNSQQFFYTSTSEAMPNVKQIDSAVDVGRGIDNDHSYAETIQKLENDVMRAKAKLHRLNTKNPLLLKRKSRQKKRALTNQIKYLHEKQELLKEDSTFNGLKDFSEELFSRLQKNIQIEKTTKDKYSPNLRCFALTLHFFSPLAYDYVRDNFERTLPDQSELRSWYGSIDDDFVAERFKTLKVKSKKVNKEEEQLIKALIDFDDFFKNFK